MQNQQSCQWCNEPMSEKASHCSSCGKLRKDIYKDKIKSYVFSSLGIILYTIGMYYLVDLDMKPAIICNLFSIGLFIIGASFGGKVSAIIKSNWWL